MKIKTRIIALALSLVYVLGLSGCEKSPETAAPEAVRPQLSAQKPVEAPVETLAGGGYFEPVAREEIAYQDMKSEPITLEDFAPYAQALTDAAASGSREAFHRACQEAYDMLVSIDTAASLMELQSDMDAGDEALGEAATDQLQVYYDAVDLYQKTLHEISAGENASCLGREFDTWQVELFKAYDEQSSAESLALTNEETQLERQYAVLSAQDEMDYDAAAEVYLQLVDVRNQMAQAEGAASFADYAYGYYYSRDYTPADAQAIWKTAKEDYAPVLAQYEDAVTQAAYESGVDERLDCSEENILQSLQYGAARMSPEINRACNYLLSNGLYDISDSDDKLYTGYTSYLYSYDVPFIFNCPYGNFNDFTDLYHEFGHWLAAYYHPSDPLYGVADFDLSELQSQGMEMMFLQYYDEIFGSDAPVLRAQVLLNLVYGVVKGAMYDEFQQRVYAEENLTKDRLLDIFREVYADYGQQTYDGYEYEWVRVIHNFQQPMYYISYAVSAIPALELYAMSLEDPADAMDAYLRVAGMGDEEYYLTDALREAGLSNTMKAPIADVIIDEIVQSGAFDVQTK